MGRELERITDVSDNSMSETLDNLNGKESSFELEDGKLKNASDEEVPIEFNDEEIKDGDWNDNVNPQEEIPLEFNDEEIKDGDWNDNVNPQEEIPLEFNDEEIHESKTNNDESVVENSKNIERTSKPEDQYITNDKLEEWEENPENNKKLDYGKEHSSDVLRKNMEIVTGKNPENSAAHHLVGNDTPEAAKALDKYQIDRNSPANGIFLPNSVESELKGSIHDGRHCKEYCNEVDRRFKNVTSREEALEVLDSLKEDLYNGSLNVNKDNRYNK